MDVLPAHAPLSGGLAALEARVARDLALIAYPEPRWVPGRVSGSGEPILDVLVVGAGQGGLVTLFALLRDRVTNILAIDRKPEGQEGPWRDFARMVTLRSWKTVTGPDLDIPSLTFQSWFEAQWGEAAFEALGKIPKGMWADYLLWYRRVLGLPVRNGMELVSLAPGADGLAATLREAGQQRTVVARKVVLVTGIETPGRWWMPEFIAALPSHLRAHTAEAIDFAALSGKRVAVLGAGASAFDNAATALEHGAQVTLCCRRPELQRVQPYKQISHAGFFRGFPHLPDAQRWRWMNHLLSVREAFPRETWERATRHAGFTLRTGSPWLGARARGDHVEIDTPQSVLEADFIICGTGFEMDISAHPALWPHAGLIATWGDRHTPAEGEENPRLARFPYLTAGFALTEKMPGTAPWLANIHLFSFGATVSFGPSGSSINAMKFAAPRLAQAIAADLFAADAEAHYQAMLAYDTPEFPLPGET
ncbi:FAD-dependent oxidoreductase [Elioraea rosea]|uniref:FAD-dependent oxidoreductase n=1 Tax=Elioraea rosea TaxID=2492390 RepID=UPI0011835071|nr:NAD(P)/FAD-dependent oxidoreductase [Elioraea rosea]